MNLSETATIRVLTVRRAVVYDGDAQRAEAAAQALRELGLEPLLIDHAALMRAVIQSPHSPPALLIGELGDCDWVEIGAALREQLGDVPVVAYGPAAGAEQLMHAVGASRVRPLAFPFTSAELAAALRVPAQATLEAVRDVRMPTGASTAIRNVVRLIRQVAAHDSSVLVLGETGAGKELVARAVHEASPRRQRPFVAINCGAIPAELLESELFGHEKGAFTGAVSARKGRFEIAEGGTLFLDEIGDMSLPMQVKLLRVLQERVFERVGSHTPIRCNVRIIAATHRNLEQAIARGAFREDLFYRLNVFPIETPSLRSRIEDLPLLLRDFIERNAAEGRGRIEFSARARAVLSRYPWPGNVRELANLVERLSILCPNRRVDVADLPPKYRPPELLADLEADEQFFEETDLAGGPASTFDSPEEPLDEQEPLAVSTFARGEGAEVIAQLPPDGLDLRDHLYSIERHLIQQALNRANGTVAHAARLLKLRRTTLVEKLRKFEMLNETAAL
ncbi:MAG TPA: sigma-54 dependent transcriptional regulator [Steroidobacter sp.]|jgi:sigma-54 specific flagellar transcriptional regulator A|nr:sigma-54 dependent transcriptional regulator [Steroidobacteraceae bacterium]HLS82565.1 sigma-54 dependent transcriptional regulator [Steroidobacter sp.]